MGSHVPPSTHPIVASKLQSSPNTPLLDPAYSRKNTPVLLHVDPALLVIMDTVSQPNVPLPPPEPPPSYPPTPFNLPTNDTSMDDMPILVEDVLVDEESLCDEESAASNSSAESFDEEMKALYDDHDSGARLFNQFTATPPWTSHPTINTTEVLNDFDKSSYPSGSVVDMSRPPSPVDLCDFPYYLHLKLILYAKSEAPPTCVEHDLLIKSSI